MQCFEGLQGFRGFLGSFCCFFWFIVLWKFHGFEAFIGFVCRVQSCFFFYVSLSGFPRALKPLTPLSVFGYSVGVKSPLVLGNS